MKKFRCKNLLITGGAGFIGSNYIDYILNNYENLNIYNLDKLTYAGNKKNILKFEDYKAYKFIHGDICDEVLLKNIFKNHEIDGVINFAAESHVDNSILNPDLFVQSNIIGVHKLLKAAYLTWMEGPNKRKEKFAKSRFHQISTDEVYGSIKKGSFTEKSRYLPNSPYSASKASADMLVRSYSKTYGLDTTISISSNNYGPNQNIEKLIPQIIYCLKNDKKVSIYGNGLNVRNWLHVIDNVIGIDLIFNKSESGESYNIGSSDELTNMMVYKIIYSQIFNDDNYHKKINFTENRPGHDYRYSLDCDKIKKHLSWKPQFNFKDEIKNIINKY